MNNFTLQQNLQRQSEQDPFAQAPQQEADGMKHPFQNLNFADEFEQLMQQPTMKQMQEPLQTLDYKQLAAQYGINLKGINPNKEIGSLQLMKRMQEVFGTNFQQHEAFAPMMRSFQLQASNQTTNRDIAETTKAERTLGAIMGMKKP